MAWQQWSSGTPVIPGLTGIVNAAPVVNPTGVLPPGAQYTPEQWAQMQQQNWQQWAQWQQQYQQWHQQYGAEYQKSMTALSQAALQPSMPNTSVPPPLPPEVKPPQPPEEPTKEDRSFGTTTQPNFSAPPPVFQPNNPNKSAPAQLHHQPQSNQQPSFNYNNQNNRNFGNYQQNRNNQTKPPSLMSLSVKKPEFGKENDSKRMKMDSTHSQKTDTAAQNTKMDTDTQSSTLLHPNEELSETEKRFIKQFTEWEAQFNKWKEQNVNHPDKEQYREYEKKWEAWRSQLLERREQMRRKRLGLLENQKPPAVQQTNTNQPKTDSSSKPHQGSTFESTESEVKDDGSSFLKLTSSDGIPGLDLVRDAPDQEGAPSKEDPVIELDKSPKNFNKAGPDLEAISKGINSILGDQKLLSMLSMVSQNQKIQPASSVTDCTSKIHDARDSEREINDVSSQGAWSAHGNQKNFDNVSNYDDQSRSSFGAKQEQDWNTKGYDRDYDSYGNSNYAKGPVFRGRNQENYRDPENYQAFCSFQGTDNFQGADNLKGPDNFRGPNKPTGPGHFEPPPDNLQAAETLRGLNKSSGSGIFEPPDNIQGLNKSSGSGIFEPPDSFRGSDNLQGSDNLRGSNKPSGVVNFEPPDNRGQDNCRGPDSFRAPDNFRGPGNIRGSNSFKGQGNFQPHDSSRGPDNFRGGGGDNFRTGDHFCASDKSRGPNNFKGPSNFKGQGNFSEQDDFQEANNFGGHDNFCGPNNMRGPGNFRRGNNFLGRDNFRGPNNFNQSSFGDQEDYHQQDEFEEQGRYGRGENFRQDNFQEGNNFQSGKRFEPPAKFQNPGNIAGSNFQNQNFRRNFSGNNPQFDDHVGRGDDEYHNEYYDNYHEAQEYHDQFAGNDRNSGSGRDFDDNRFDSHRYDEDYGEDNMQGYEEHNYDGGHGPSMMGDPMGGEPVEEETLIKPTSDIAPVGDGMWQPVSVIEYEHKSQKPEEMAVSIEPLRTFDYRHKPVNRIPLPQRPDWLKKTLRNCREFDFVFSRYDQPSYNRFASDRYDREDRRKLDEYRSGNRRGMDDISSHDYDSRQVSSPRGKYDEPQRAKYEEPARGRYEESPRVKFEEPQRGKYEETQRGRFEVPQRGKYDDLSRGRYEEPERAKFEEPQRGKYDGGPRGRYEEQQRGKYDEPQRGKFEEPPRARYEELQRGRYEEPERPKYEEPHRGRFEEPHKGRFEEPQRGRFEEPQRGRFDESQRGRFEEPPSKIFCDRPPFGKDMKDKEIMFGRDSDRESNDFNKDLQNKEGVNKEIKMSPSQPVPTKNITLIEDILNPPGRFSRPARIVIILRGPPGSGKTFLAKLIKDKEVENGGSAPRILSLDDYFMVEQEKEVEEDGKKTKIKVMEYEYDASMEIIYRNSLFKAFKKTITDGYFPFIIVDNINDKVKYFGEMWSFAKQNGFQVYVCQLEFDLSTCTKRNIHNRSEAEIQKIISGWESTPSHHPSLDTTSLVQSASIPEVEMEEINSPPSDNFDDDSAEEKAVSSKWDNFDCSLGNLAKLDGTSKPLRASKTMEDYLQIDDDWVSRESKPGQKRVRWADLEERKEQQKMRAIGFVVGQTNWDRMMDPTMGSGALTQTKYIERVPRYYRD